MEPRTLRQTLETGISDADVAMTAELVDCELLIPEVENGQVLYGLQSKELSDKNLKDKLRDEVLAELDEAIPSHTSDFSLLARATKKTPLRGVHRSTFL